MVISLTLSRQRGDLSGDPLSPYLFLFHTEALNALCRDSKMRSVLRGVAVAPTSPRISHLLFVDDTLLFCQSTLEPTLEINSILHRYSMASG